jgi:hypothetical protein
MAQMNITMLSQQPYGNQFRVGEILIPNMDAFENLTEYRQFLEEANRIPKSGGTYEFRVVRLHGNSKNDGAEVVLSPDFPAYIQVDGSEARFPERFFLRKEP